MSVQVQLRRDTYTNVAANHGAAGEVFVDTTNQRLVVQDGATVGGFPAITTLSVQNGGDTNNSNSGSGSDHDHNLTFTIPANFMIAARAFRVFAHLQLTTGSGPPTLTHKIKLGSTAIGQSAPITLFASTTNEQIGMEWIFQSTQAPGASANVQCTNFGAINQGATAANSNMAAMPVAIATNAAQVLKITTFWNAVGTGTTTITLNQLIVEALN
jgi:Major tropism determinant N-terminal domain